MPALRRLLWSWAIVVTIGGSTAAAHGQDTEAPTDPEAQRTAIARALFDEGLALADQRQWAAAADRFRRALEVRPSAPIRYNLGQTLGRLGRLVEAVETLRLVEADATAEPDVRASATPLRRRLERRLARLTVTVTGPGEDAEVTLDGLTLPAAILGVRFPVDPGAHRVTLRQGGEEVDRAQLEVAEGASAEVRLDPRATAVAAATGGSVWEQGWFWAAVGLVVASGLLAALVVATADDAPAGAGALSL